MERLFFKIIFQKIKLGYNGFKNRKIKKDTNMIKNDI